MDWYSSQAHLLFLSKFLKLYSIDNIGDYWDGVLGETVAEAIERFVSERMLRQGNLIERLAAKYTVADLKALCKARSMPISGKKDQLIQRLVNADPVGIEREIVDFQVFCATEEGITIAQRFLDLQKQERLKAEQSVLQALLAHRFSDAVQAVVAFESNQVFQRGLGIDWRNYAFADQDLIILESIFVCHPMILAHIERSALEPFRMAAAMMYLWGSPRAQDWIDPSIHVESRFDHDTIARMILFHAYYLRRLAWFRQSKVEAVRVLPANDSCSECKKHEGMLYNLEEVPELPYSGCASECGCRCTLIADTFRH